jgi:hypothetical protein
MSADQFWLASQATQVCDTCHQPKRLPLFAIVADGKSRDTTCRTCRRAIERAELKAKNDAARSAVTPEKLERTAKSLSRAAATWYVPEAGRVRRRAS